MTAPRIVLRLVGALTMLLGPAVHGWAQASVTLSGVAENESGAGTPYVSVTLIPMTTADPRETVSDGRGGFSFPSVAPGRYLLKAAAPESEPVDLLVTVGTLPPPPVRLTLKRHRHGDLEEGPVVEAVAAGPEPVGPRDPSAAAQVPARADGDGTATKAARAADTAPEEPSPPVLEGQGVPPQPQPGAGSPPRLWSVGFTASNSYDSNVDHDLRSVGVYGLAYGTAAYYRSSQIRPLFQVAYSITRYSVPRAARWDRVSHFLSTAVERRLNRRLYVDAVANFLTGGTSEDREIVNQYLVRPRVEFRLPRDHRVRIYAAQRLKRYTNTAVRDATNRYVGVEMQRRLETGDRWLIGYRYEQNRSVGLRHRYRRLTYETEYMTALTGRDSVTFNVMYRSQVYPYRLAELHDINVPRHNQRWIPSLWWAHRIGARADVRVEYIFETQSSNDLNEPYAAHNLGFSIGYIW